MKRSIENGNRYQAVIDSLAADKGVVVIGETTTERFDNKKFNLYHEVQIAVAPADPNNAEGFSAALLADIKPIFRHGESLKTFDTLGERSFRPITVVVYPNVAAAQEAAKE